MGFYGAPMGIVGLCGIWWCVGVVGLWGVSIMREWGKDKANPLEKHKKNLTRGFKKSYTNYKGEWKILWKGEEEFFY